MNIRYSAVLAVVGLLLFGAWAPPLQAQDPVEGVVTDANTGNPIPGANVVWQGTGVGTTTDVNGRYTIERPGGAMTLVFSFIGYREQEVEVPEGQSQVNVQLQEDVVGLEEVVVTGLGSSVKRENLANSVETVDAAELVGTTAPQTLDGALSGKVTGAQISSYSGAPGGGMSIKLRGVSTINGNSQPLYIVDGVFVDNSSISNNANAVTQAAAGGNRSSQDNPVNRIADLNPRDIQSIEILKGPSAAAIYGGRASNGVVIITTKRGQAGETRVNVSQSVGITTIRKTLGMRDFTAETAEASFGETGRELFLEAQNGRGFTDYEEELFGQEGLLSTTSLSVNGGNEDTRFFVSGLLQNDEGIVERTGYDKRSIRANITHDFSESLSFNGTANYVNSAARRGLTGNDNSGTTFGVALTATPNFIDILPDENGNYPNHPFNASNPIQTRDQFSNVETINRIISSGKLQYDVLANDRQSLQLIAQGGVDHYTLESDLLFPRFLQFEAASPEPGTSIITRATSLSTNVRLIGVHSYSLPDQGITLTTQGGVTGFRNDQDINNVVANNLIPGQKNVDQSGSLNIGQDRFFQNERSFFIQEEVNYDDRVVVTGGLRGDRSSLNGDVERFYLYPRASAAINLHNFGFWTVDAVSQLKLRAAFGQTGNTAAFGTKFTSFGAVTVGGSNGTLIDTQRGLDDVEPERQTEIEGGVDLSMLQERVSLSVTGYRKEITDQLLQRELPSSTGFRLETFNGGTLVNTGVETSLTLLPVTTDDIEWISTTNFWTNNAEVTDLPVPAFRAVGGGFGATLGEIRIEEGKSPTQIVGVDDRDGDGVSDGVFQLGDAAPDFEMSFSNNVRFFDSITLSVLAHWKKGGDNLNLSELLFDLNGTTPDYDDDDNGNGVADGVDRVNQLGVSAETFVQDASYFRIRELGLFYDLPTSLLDGAFNGLVRSVRVGASARNWFTITPYKSYDPEVNNFGSQPVARGVEVTPFPQSKQLYFHLDIGL